LTITLAVAAFWYAYEAWDAHVELGDSHGPFLFAAIVAVVVGAGLAGLSVWLLVREVKGATRASGDNDL
jgi:hypothetical protein